MNNHNHAGAGAERVVKRTVRGHDFVFRRPFQGDVSEIGRRYAAKVVVTGLDAETQVLNEMMGLDFLWEARLEVCLRPRRIAGGVVDLGETAPDHWLRDGLVVFDRVDVAEFAEVVASLAPLFEPATAVPVAG